MEGCYIGLGKECCEEKDIEKGYMVMNKECVG